MSIRTTQNQFIMILKSSYILAYIFLYNSITLTVSSEIQQNQETILVESNSLTEPNGLQELNKALQLKLNISLIEEKLNSLPAIIGEMKKSMSSLVNNNIDFLDKHIRSIFDQIFGEKIQSVKQIQKGKLKSIENKSQYTVQEVKCNDRLPRDCKEVNECNNNIYRVIVPEFSNDTFPVVCDLKTLDGGWTIIQRRQDGTEDFYRNWTEYVKGFGNLNGEFFIGLEKLHALTTQGAPQELYVILEDFEGTRKYAKYGLFKVDSEQNGYNLTIGSYTGTAGDSFSYHNGCKFSTKDRDNDVSKNSNCAERYRGAWWHKSCYESNLNGMYLGGHLPNSQRGRGIAWNSFRGHDYSLKFVQMMIREKQN